MTAGFTSKFTASTHTYFMKALHCQLLVAVQKHLYDKHYPSVLCLYCEDVEVSDHVFSCMVDDLACYCLLNVHTTIWYTLSGLFISSLCVSHLLSSCVLNAAVCTALCKSFVFKDWLYETVLVFRDSKAISQKIVNFVYDFCLAFREKIWLVHVKHHAFMEKNRLILSDGSIPGSVSGLSSLFSAGVVKLLSINEIFGIEFGFHKPCLFLLDIEGPVSVYIDA
ncbi:hypothetical protein G9A89_016826 [Geosiphon pyriformis]|nr:hypothetical protein G9A89_016826 [Geosiphon pyriformis]